MPEQYDRTHHGYRARDIQPDQRPPGRTGPEDGALMFDASKPLPGFLLIGASKAGTTSMHHYLAQHPELSMSYPKETNFFTRADCMSAEARAWYLRCFDGAGLRGEASPRYTHFPVDDHVPERIFTLIPEAKLIFLVRDPVERAESHYYHNYFNRSESRPIDRVFAELEDDDYPLVLPSRYGMQLERYLQYFPMSQILVVDNDDLRHDRAATMSSVFSFLGVDPEFSSSAFERRIKDRATTVRLSPVAAQLQVSAPARLGRRVLPIGVREPFYKSVREMLSPALEELSRAPASPEVRARVAGFFREDAARFRELTGLPFHHWSV